MVAERENIQVTEEKELLQQRTQHRSGNFRRRSAG